MVNVVMDQRPLRLGHSAFDGVQLRRQIDAGPPLLNHGDDTAKVALGALQPSRDGGVACMDMRF